MTHDSKPSVRYLNPSDKARLRESAKNAVTRVLLAPQTLNALLDEIEALRVDARRYQWLANRVCACDYGDNDAPGGRIGWLIRGDAKDGPFMFGPSIDTAIDAARQKETP